MNQVQLELIKNSGFFTAWRDPVSGVVSWVLRHKLAPVQQTFYFTHDCISPDGRWLYTTCAFPPSGFGPHGKCLAVYDLVEKRCALLPETGFWGQNVMLDHVNGSCVWMTGGRLFQRVHSLTAQPQLLAGVSHDFHKNRGFERYATHINYNADRSEVCLDARTVNRSVMGSLPLRDASSIIWAEEQGSNVNHGQFHPHDPDLLMVAKDHWHDAVTGEWHPIDTRIWLVRRPGAKRSLPNEPLAGQLFPLIRDTPEDRRCHEWWSADGTHVWVVDYHKGTQKIDLSTREIMTVWSGGTCHSHASADDRFLAGDRNVYDWDKSPCSVAFYDVETKTETAIVSSMPLPPGGMDTRRQYHVDPHPHFCCNDSLIAYTTTVPGDITVAFTAMQDMSANFRQ